MQHTRILCAAALGMVVLWSSAASASKGPDNRSYVTGNWALVLDGANCGFVKSVAGGGITAEVINEAKAPGAFVKKHIGQPKYEAFTAQVGFSQAKPLYDWISQSWAMKPTRKNGSVVGLNFELHPTSERQFLNALLTEVTIPAMDGSSKEPAYLTVTFAPEIIRAVKPTGQAKDYAEYGKNEQKVWLPSNFRLEIAGLDCTKVTKIDSFTVKQTAVTEAVGDARDYAKEPGKLEFPNLKITLPEAASQSFSAWHESFVVQGKNDESQEKNGSLTLLSPNRQTELVRIKFFNLGIFRLQSEKAEANADQIKRVTAELYVERMEFEYLNKPVGSETPATSPATTPTPVTTPAKTLMRRG